MWEENHALEEGKLRIGYLEVNRMKNEDVE